MYSTERVYTAAELAAGDGWQRRFDAVLVGGGVDADHWWGAHWAGDMVSLRRTDTRGRQVETYARTVPPATQLKLVLKAAIVQQVRVARLGQLAPEIPPARIADDLALLRDASSSTELLEIRRRLVHAYSLARHQVDLVTVARDRLAALDTLLDTMEIPRPDVR